MDAEVGDVDDTSPATEDFRKALRRLFRAALGDHVDVKSGDLHRKVGDCPGPSHRMPACCSAMRGLMGEGDEVVEEPPSGQGASLVIRYRLPR